MKAPVQALTVAEALAGAARRLAAVGVPSPEADARLLLGHVLGRKALELVVEGGRQLTPLEQDGFGALVEARADRRPLQHLIGDVEFYGRNFRVGAGVLIPRPETEAVVEAALGVLDASIPPLTPAFAKVADIGSGTGVIGLTLAAERPQVQVWCVDREAAAAALTARNAVELAVAGRVRVLRGDGVAALAREAFDLVVSNPPYLPSAMIPTLEPEVRDHDPRIALDGGPDGLGVIRRLLDEAGRVLRPGGHLVIEIGHDQGGTVTRLAAQGGWQTVTIRPDLAGYDRVLIARRGA